MTDDRRLEVWTGTTAELVDELRAALPGAPEVDAIEAMVRQLDMGDGETLTIVKFRECDG